MQRENIADSAAVQAVRSPKIPHSLPRPLTELDAERVVQEAEEAGENWLAMTEDGGPDAMWTTVTELWREKLEEKSSEALA